MVSVEILVQGYAHEKKQGWEANATTTLITTDKHRIVVDPGMDRPALQKGLKENAVDPGEVTDVYMTHYHVDHMLNVTVFPQARLVDGKYGILGNSGIFHNGQPFGRCITIIPTPGHVPGHTSLAVSTEKCVYLIAGDVIWQPVKTLHEALELPDPYAYDRDILLKSRANIWQIADIIIPGHGSSFKPK